MAQLNHRKVLLFYVLFFLSVSICFSASWFEPQHQSTNRRMLGAEKEDQADKPLKKKTTTKLIKPTTKNQTKTILKSDNISSKTIKPNLVSSKNQTKTTKLSNNISSKNQTKPLKPSSSKTKPTDTNLKKLSSSNSTAPKIKKLNVTSKTPPSNPGTTVSISSNQKISDLAKASNKTTKANKENTNNNKQAKTTKVDQTHNATTTNKKPKSTPPNKQQQEQSKKKATKQAPPSWILEEEEEDDLVSEFTDLPNKFHQTLLPDLERISTTSKAYITKANNEMTKGFKPYVGKRYAPTVAAVISCAFIFIPLLLVSLLCTRIKAYFSLQKILIFIQGYLSIYFTILCVTSLFTGFEPLKFLYSTSQSTYLCLQVLQTLAYVFYLLLLLMYLVLVFSTDSGLGSKFLGLAQVFVGFAVGLHYYVTVFHRVVLQQPPKTNWKIHAIYATCFLLICVLAGADRRKKSYVEDGGGENKKN